MFNEGGAEYTRRGFMCRVRLERFGEGSIYPHEETHGSAKADRLKLWSACKANLSQIFGLFPDPQNEAQDILEAAIAGVAPLEATDHLGVIHRIWPVIDVARSPRSSAPWAIAPSTSPTVTTATKPRVTARRIAAELARRTVAEHPANFVLMMFVSMSDPGQDVLEAAIAGVAPLEATDHLGVVHRIWPVKDIRVITEVIGAMGDRPVYIADGHHRYETACTLRDEIAREHGGELSKEHPANFVLMMCVSMSDPGMLVLATHRLFRGLPPMTSAQLRERLGDCFTAEAAGNGPQRAEELWEEIEVEGDQGTLGLYTAADDAVDAGAA